MLVINLTEMPTSDLLQHREEFIDKIVQSEGVLWHPLVALGRPLWVSIVEHIEEEIHTRNSIAEGMYYFYKGYEGGL